MNEYVRLEEVTKIIEEQMRKRYCLEMGGTDRTVLNVLQVVKTRIWKLDIVEAEPVRHAKVLYNVAIEKEECCGYKKRKGLVLQKYTCSSCYTAIPGESKFCMECGATLIWRNEDEN